MKVNVPLPFDRIGAGGSESGREHTDLEQFVTMEAVADIGRVLDSAGFHAGLVTDHPVPTGRWLDAGGHHAQDPFVMLSLLGASTRNLRLQTGILVLPYRNPFIVARSVATLDRFTNGRVTLSVGAGYLKGEYRAVGVDFARRNELTDEYLRALQVSLSGGEFAFQGEGFEAFGNRILPAPVQKPHPPLLVGGNSRRAIRRAVELGDGWNPFFTSIAGVDLTTTRTSAITGEADLRVALDYMREHCEKVGRADLPDVVLGGVTSPGEVWTSESLVDRIGRFAELGVTAVAVTVDGATRSEWCDNAERIGAEVIAKV